MKSNERERRALASRLHDVENFMRSINPKLARYAELNKERARLIELQRALEPYQTSHVAN